MTEHTKFFVDHNAPDYYYTKKSQVLIDLGQAPHQEHISNIVTYCTENKNPLNYFVPGFNLVSYNIKGHPTDFYHWPIPFCFTWEAYQASAIEGITLYNIAKEFWDNIAAIKTDADHPEGFTVLSADIRCFPPGTHTMRYSENPGGPKSGKWMEGGSCRLMIPLSVPTGAVIQSGSVKNPDVLELTVNQVYEFNNKVPYKYINDTTPGDFIVISIDLVPNSKAAEAETRILAHPTLSQLHVTVASGYPVHNTLYL
jgi:hypothetical protein